MIKAKARDEITVFYLPNMDFKQKDFLYASIYLLEKFPYEVRHTGSNSIHSEHLCKSS